MTHYRWRGAALLVTVLGCGGALSAAAVPVRTGAQIPVQNTAQMTEGRELFNRHCASCHGVTGAGNGPAAAAMRRSPPDITALTLANGGMFPVERVRRIVDGRDVEAHGNREMPVWGDIFKAVPGGRSEEAVRTRIRSILKYLMSIQRRQA
jgi:mono/diheme cytochrome c family protein